jgi:hypothetical protein
VVGFIGLPPLRFAGARDAYSELLSGPGIVPRQSDGKETTPPIILEGASRCPRSPATSAKFIYFRVEAVAWQAGRASD